MRYVLDTNTISYALRGVSAVTDRLRASAPSEFGVPAIVLYELMYGILRIGPGAKAKQIQEGLAQLIRPMVILDFDDACAIQAANLRVGLERQGSPIGPMDTLIAAVALRHSATLITRNVAEFSRVPGLRLQNWFD